MTNEELIEHIKQKQSFLCVGLDSDISKIPSHLLHFEDPVFEFNKQIIDATASYCVAYKPNTAFYESEGVQGWVSLEKTAHYIKKKYPDQFLIADAKRGDIGNTSKLYAKAFFENMPFDAVTVAPYMGIDSVKPFLDYKNKWVILLVLTSNEGSHDFQTLEVNEEKKLFEKVIEKSQQWGSSENMMYVVGATRGETIQQVRNAVPNHFFLVPGVGAQGGSLEDVFRYGANQNCGLLVNSSRGIIFASSGKDFAEKASEEAKKLQTAMKKMLINQ